MKSITATNKNTNLISIEWDEKKKVQKLTVINDDTDQEIATQLIACYKKDDTIYFIAISGLEMRLILGDKNLFWIGSYKNGYALVYHTPYFN